MTTKPKPDKPGKPITPQDDSGGTGNGPPPDKK